MAIRNFAKYLAVAVFAAACQVQQPQNPQAPTNESEPAASLPCFTPGVVTVEFDDAAVARIESALQAGQALTKASGLEGVPEGIDITSMERVFPDAGEYEALHRKCGLHRFYIVRFNKTQPVTKAVAGIGSISGIVSVTPSRKISPRSFNDPKLSMQWHIVNTAYPSADIRVKEVWEQYTTGDPRVIVAVMDEGVNYKHEDLKDNMWTGEGGIHGYNALLDNNSIYYTGDYASGHGTHVAGIVAAVNNNGKGGCGVAGGNSASGQKGVRIMSVPVLYVNEMEETAFDEETDIMDAGGDEYIVPRAYTWAADHGAVISQNSWGYAADQDDDGKVSASELAAFKDMSLARNLPAMKAAVDYFMEFAGCNPDGTQREDSPMKGGLIFFAAGNEGDLGINYDPVCDYEPIIAVGATGKNGKAAFYSQYGPWVDIAAPGGSQTDILSTMHESSDSYGEMMGTSQACPHASGVAALIVSYFGGPGFTADMAKDILFGGLGNTIGGSKPVGRKLDALASFEYGLGTSGGSSEENHAPQISFYPESVTLKAHESAVISVDVSDPDGDIVDLYLESAGSRALTFDESTMTLGISAALVPEGGSFTAVLKAADTPFLGSVKPLSSTAYFNYTILPNHAPSVVKDIEDTYRHGLEAISISNPAHFNDIDGEDLRYSVRVEDTSVATATVTGESTVITPKNYGVTTVTISAQDGLDATARLSFRLAFVNPQQPVTVIDSHVTGELRLNIDSPSPVLAQVQVFNAAGAMALRQEFTASAFSPILVDVSSLAPGRYTAMVKYGGKAHSVKFAKY